MKQQNGPEDIPYLNSYIAHDDKLDIPIPRDDEI